MRYSIAYAIKNAAKFITHRSDAFSGRGITMFLYILGNGRLSHKRRFRVSETIKRPQEGSMGLRGISGVIMRFQGVAGSHRGSPESFRSLRGISGGLKGVPGDIKGVTGDH